MMMALLIMSTLALLCIVALGLISYNQNKKIAHLQRSQLSSRKEINMLRNADLVIGKHINGMIDDLKTLEDNQDKLNTKMVSQGGYNQGLKMLEMGGEVKDLIDTCNLSRAEAELLSNLHDYKEAHSVSHEP